MLLVNWNQINSLKKKAAFFQFIYLNSLQNLEAGQLIDLDNFHIHLTHDHNLRFNRDLRLCFGWPDLSINFAFATVH
jgi:hypothetical protein